MPQTQLTIRTEGQGLYEFTDQVAGFVKRQAPGEGLLTVFVRHTSCSLLIQENADPDVRRDLKTFFSRLVPHSDTAAMNWVTHTMEGPDDMPAHIKAALTPVSLAIPERRSSPPRHMAGDLPLRASRPPAQPQHRVASFPVISDEPLVNAGFGERSAEAT